MLIILQLGCAASVSFRSWVSEGGTPLGPQPRWEIIKNAPFLLKATCATLSAGAKGLVPYV